MDQFFLHQAGLTEVAPQAVVVEPNRNGFSPALRRNNLPLQSATASSRLLIYAKLQMPALTADIEDNVLVLEDAGVARVQFRLLSGKVVIDIRDAAGALLTSIESLGSFTPGQLLEIVATYDGVAASKQLYINGAIEVGGGVAAVAGSVPLAGVTHVGVLCRGTTPEATWRSGDVHRVALWQDTAPDLTMPAARDSVADHTQRAAQGGTCLIDIFGTTDHWDRGINHGAGGNLRRGNLGAHFGTQTLWTPADIADFATSCELWVDPMSPNYRRTPMLGGGAYAALTDLTGKNTVDHWDSYRHPSRNGSQYDRTSYHNRDAMFFGGEQTLLIAPGVPGNQRITAFVAHRTLDHTTPQALMGGGGTVLVACDPNGTTSPFGQFTNVVVRLQGQVVPTWTTSAQSYTDIKGVKERRQVFSLEGDLAAGKSVTELGDGAGRWRGAVGEIIIFNRALTVDESEKIEGYLAWKWGHPNNLVAGHTYRGAAPRIATAPAPAQPLAGLGLQAGPTLAVGGLTASTALTSVDLAAGGTLSRPNLALPALSPAALTVAGVLGLATLTGTTLLLPAALTGGAGVGAPTLTAQSLVAPTGLVAASLVSAPGVVAATQLSVPGQTSTPRLGAPHIAAQAVLTPRGLIAAGTLGAATLSAQTQLAAAGLVAAGTIGAPALTAATQIPAAGLGAAALVPTPALTAVTLLGGADLAAGPRLAAPALATGTTLSPAALVLGPLLGSPSLSLSSTLSALGLSAAPRLGAPALFTGTALEAQGLGLGSRLAAPALATGTQLAAQGLLTDAALDAAGLTAGTTLAPAGLRLAGLLPAAGLTAGTTLAAPGFTFAPRLAAPALATGTTLGAQGLIGAPELAAAGLLARTTLAGAGLRAAARLSIPALAAETLLSAAVLSTVAHLARPALASGTTLSPLGLVLLGSVSTGAVFAAGITVAATRLTAVPAPRRHLAVAPEARTLSVPAPRRILKVE